MEQYIPKLNILIAEDDDAAAHLIKTNLKRTGIEANFIRAKDGQEALEMLADPSKAKPHFSYKDKLVVLLDIRMPKLDGIQVLKSIKKSERFKKLPVIMFTTSSRDVEVAKCYELGCNFYFKKRVDYKEFTETIKSLAAFLERSELPVLGELTPHV